MNILISCIVLLPLLGFLNIGIGRLFVYPRKLIYCIGLGTLLLAFVFSLVVFFVLTHEELQAGLTISWYNFLSVEGVTIDIAWLVDSLSLLFMLVITGIGLLIHLFSVGYMSEENDDHFARYFSYLNLFIFFMLLLVMGNNLVATFMGWEGVGLCSYLLIGYWYKKDAYVGAANKAFIMNRIGDLAFLIATFLCIYYFRSVEYKTLETLFITSGSVLPSVFALSAIGLLLFFAATGKSAQIPLFTWLPDAMAGPTPVSALIHAATMVTAGIFLITRLYFLIDFTPIVREVMLVIGTSTALVAATTATVQKDIKKVLAYSTVSQLGFMVVALGMGAYTTAVFHVFTHAFFKALLFLGSGSIIYVLHHEQLMSNMGGLKKLLPITHITFLIACLGIAGIPPFAGFFSKDEILAGLFEHHFAVYLFMQATALLTTFYMFRLYTIVFLGQYRGKLDIKHIHDPSHIFTVPLIVLAAGVLVVGGLGIPSFIAEWFGTLHVLNEYLDKWHGKLVHGLDHNTELLLMLVAVVGSCMVLLATIWVYRKRSNMHHQDTELSSWQHFLFHQWGLDECYRIIIVLPLRRISRFLYYYVDQLFLRNIPWQLEAMAFRIGKRLQVLQSGYLSHYIAWMIIAIFIIVLSVAIWI